MVIAYNNECELDRFNLSLLHVCDVPSPRQKRKFRKDIHGDCSTKKRRVRSTELDGASSKQEKCNPYPNKSPTSKEQATIAADKLDEGLGGRFTTYGSHVKTLLGLIITHGGSTMSTKPIILSAL